MEQKYTKQYVAVDVHYTEEGKIEPRIIYWPDGRNFFIEKITDHRPAASLKVGGAGIRFRVLISGEEATYERDLYFVDNRWFVEVKVSQMSA